MKNKGLIYFLTITISFLSIYYLQFTFVSQRIQGEATEISRDAEGNIDFKKKQKYLDSIWNQPVYNLVSDFFFSRKLITGEASDGSTTPTVFEILSWIM